MKKNTKIKNENDYSEAAKTIELQVKLEMALAALEYYARQGTDKVAKQALEHIKNL